MLNYTFSPIVLEAAIAAIKLRRGLELKVLCKENTIAC